MRRRKERGRPRAAPGESSVQGVDALRQAILDQARRQARELLHEAQLEVQAIQQRAEQEAEEIGQEILSRAHHEMALEKQRRISAAQLEVHRKQLARREDQIAGVFVAVNDRLTELRHAAGYAEILWKLTVEAAAALGGGELVVSANQEDADLLTDEFLARAARAVKVDTTLERSQEFLSGGGGVLVETADGRMRYDNTFAGRMQRFRDLLRTAAYDVLTREN